jgi:ATP-dependent helicase IRC3
MELKEIKAIVSDIIRSIDNNKNDYTYRAFDNFVTGAGNRTPRNIELLKKFEYQFKKHGLTLHSGREERKTIFDITKQETVTFRKNGHAPVNAEERHNERKVAFQYAGTINIAQEESGITLYKHQEEAVEKLETKIVRSNKNPFEGLLVLPTGGGKTLTAAYWIAKNYLDKGKKVLWIAHRHELLEQAQRTFHKQLSYKDIFPNKARFNYRLISGIHDKPVNIQGTDDIIISSKDSLTAGFDHLYNNWLKGNAKEIFLVIDEAHHATAKTYRKLIKNLRDRVSEFRLLGLTATPFRTAEDEQGLLAKVFPDDIVYKVDLRTLISRGILSEPIFEEVRTEFDMTRYLDDEQLDNLQYFDIESIGRSTAQTIAENDQRNWAIVSRYVNNKSKYKQTIVFALNVFNAIALNKLFLEQGIKSDFVISTVKDMATGVSLKKDNPEIINRFRKGELEVLINVNILTEGTDIPNVQSVFLARPTISPILMTQMIGRGLRGERAGGTKEAFIVSFIDEWREKVAWVNPEKLLIEENINFNDKQTDTKKQLIRLVAISKVEEFASLTNKTIAADVREELEKLDFIERIPLGIYHFSILQPFDGEAHEKNCEVLIYDNICQTYNDFIAALPMLFEKHKLTEKENLTEDELDELAEKVEDDFFMAA